MGFTSLDPSLHGQGGSRCIHVKGIDSRLNGVFDQRLLHTACDGFAAPRAFLFTKKGYTPTSSVHKLHKFDPCRSGL